jgi:hypothetical protein
MNWAVRRKRLRLLLLNEIDWAFDYDLLAAALSLDLDNRGFCATMYTKKS